MDLLTAVRGAIARKGTKQLAKIRGLDVIQQRIESLFLLTRQDEIVAFFKERDEIKSVLMSGGLQTEGYVRFACFY